MKPPFLRFKPFPCFVLMGLAAVVSVGGVLVASSSGPALATTPTPTAATASSQGADIAMVQPNCSPGNPAVTQLAALIIGRWQAGSDETMTLTFDRKGRFEQLYFGNKDFDATHDSGGTYKVEGDKITLTWMVKEDGQHPIGQWVGYWQPGSKTLAFPANECHHYGEPAKAMETFTRISD